MGFRGLMPFLGRSPDPNPCMPFIVNIYFPVHALAVSVLYNLRSGIKMYNAQSSMSNLQDFHDCLALRLVTPFLSNSLKALVMQTVANHFSISHISTSTACFQGVFPGCTFYCSQPFTWG